MTEWPWICFDCGYKYGKTKREIFTIHPNTCGWCGEKKSVTHYRDFGYPTNSLPIPTKSVENDV